jgi:glucans biosynthesis protein C
MMNRFLRYCSLVTSILAAVMVTQSVTSLPGFFSFGGAVYLLPYFLFGIVLREQARWLLTVQTADIALGVVIIVLVTQQFSLNGMANEITLMQLPAALAGMACVVFLLQRFPRNVTLAAIGRYSYTIYLWQVIFGAGARLVLLKAGIHNDFVLFCSIFAVGISAPIVLHVWAARYPRVCLVLTGTRGLPGVGKKRSRLALAGSNTGGELIAAAHS